MRANLLARRGLFPFARPLALLVVGTIAIGSAAAAEVRILSAGAVKAPLSKRIEALREAEGIEAVATYATAGAVRERLAGGERADIVILPREALDALAQKGAIVEDSRQALGEVGVGIAVRQGAPLPDIATPDALRATLLAAKSIVYVDPEKGTSGRHVEAMLRTLGIAEAVRAKTTRLDGGYVVEPVARGEIEIGLHQISEILPVPGVQLVEPLPPSLQKTTVYEAAILKDAASPRKAAASIRFLITPASRAVFVQSGFATPR